MCVEDPFSQIWSHILPYRELEIHIVKWTLVFSGYKSLFVRPGHKFDALKGMLVNLPVAIPISTFGQPFSSYKTKCDFHESWYIPSKFGNLVAVQGLTESKLFSEWQQNPTPFDFYSTNSDWLIDYWDRQLCSWCYPRKLKYHSSKKIQLYKLQYIATHTNS